MLLYYSYVYVRDVDDAVLWHRAVCGHLNLHGRVRVASEGVNVVLSGARSSLQTFMHIVEADDRWGADIDFKLSGLNEHRPVEEQVFSSLSVKRSAEVVSIGLGPGVAAHDQGASHLTPAQWHALLQSVSASQGGPGAEDVVLLDTRNVYESQIGKFECAGAETLEASTRQFTDFPKFVEDHLERLRGKTVLMYCTGGVRCERASAFVLAKLAASAQPESGGRGGGGELASHADFSRGEGEGERSGARGSRVFQLRGGVHAYLKYVSGEREGVGAREGGGRALPGSFYRGKNFVFDRRRFEPMHDGSVVGRCHVCGTALCACARFCCRSLPYCVYLLHFARARARTHARTHVGR